MAQPAGGAGNSGGGGGTPVYTFFGHGSEVVTEILAEDERIPNTVDLPDGFTLVLTEECGVMGTLPAHIYDVMSDPENMAIFEDPVGHIAELSALLKKNIILYVGPTKIPNFHFTFFNDDPAGVRKVRLYQSGVLQLPLDADDAKKSFNVSKGTIQYPDVAAAYRRTIFPDLKKTFEYFAADSNEERSTASASSNEMDYDEIHVEMYDLKDKLKFFISDVFDRVGPGIYYNALCRSIYKYTPKNVLSVNSDVYNEPALVHRKLTAKAEKTANEAALLTKTEAILRAREERRGTHRSANSEHEKLLEQMAAKRLDAATTAEIIAKIQTMPQTILNTLTSPHDGDRLIHRAVTREDTAILDSLLARDVDLTVQNYQLKTPLHVACEMGMLGPFVKVLEKINPEALGIKDEDEQTVLMSACDMNHPEMVAALLTPPQFESFLAYNATDADGDTALHLACREDAGACLDLILQKHPELLRMENTDGLTPWNLAIQTGAGTCLRTIKARAPEFAVLTTSTIRQFLHHPKRVASIEGGLPILLEIGFVPNKGDLKYSIENLKSNTVAIALFDRLNAGGQLTAKDLSELKKIKSALMRGFVDHVKSAAAATRKNRRQRRLTRRRRQNIH